MTRDDDELTRAKMRHPAYRHKMLRDVEAFTRDAALKGIDVAPLRTASDFHAEADRLGTIPGAPWFVAKSRPRKARALEAVKVFCLWLLLVAALFIIISALFASAARADTADDWANVYGSAVCDTLDDYPTVSGLLGVTIGAQSSGVTMQEAAEGVVASVMTYCPERAPLLIEAKRRYGRVTA